MCRNINRCVLRFNKEILKFEVVRKFSILSV
jgi:hypothetical protein